MYAGPGVYAILNTVNDKMYIGSSVDIARRWIKHKHELRKGTHHCQPLLRAINKYGLDVFSLEIIEYASDAEKLITKEQMWLDFFKPAYNTCKIAGTVRGIKRSETTRQKLSAALKGNTNARGKIVLPETRQKLSDQAKRRQYSRVTRAKMAAAKQGKKQPPELVAKRIAAIVAAKARKKAV